MGAHIQALVEGRRGGGFLLSQICGVSRAILLTHNFLFAGSPRRSGGAPGSGGRGGDEERAAEWGERGAQAGSANTWPGEAEGEVLAGVQGREHIMFFTKG